MQSSVRGCLRDVVDFVEDDKGEDLTDAMDGLEEIKGMRIVMPGRLQYMEFEALEECVIVIDEFQVCHDTHADVGIGELLSNPGAVTLIGDLLAEWWEIILAVGVLDVGQEISASTHEVIAPAQEVSSGSHPGWVDIGLGYQASLKECCDLTGIYPVVFGLPTMYGFHV